MQDGYAQHTLLYSRLSSVNSDAVAQKICAMEGGEDAETFASGMAAISTTLMMLLNQVDHIVASADVYGGTYGLMTEELPRLGIETTMADLRDPSSYEAAFRITQRFSTLKQLRTPISKFVTFQQWLMWEATQSHCYRRQYICLTLGLSTAKQGR